MNARKIKASKRSWDWFVNRTTWFWLLFYITNLFRNRGNHGKMYTSCSMWFIYCNKYVLVSCRGWFTIEWTQHKIFQNQQFKNQELSDFPDHSNFKKTIGSVVFKIPCRKWSRNQVWRLHYHIFYFICLVEVPDEFFIQFFRLLVNR